MGSPRQLGKRREWSINLEANPASKGRSGKAGLTRPSWVQRPQGRFLSHCIVEEMSDDARKRGKGVRRKYHALRCVTIHARLGGAVTSTLPMVTILGGGSVGV